MSGYIYNYHKIISTYCIHTTPTLWALRISFDIFFLALLYCHNFVLKCTLIAAETSKEAESGFPALIIHYCEIPKYMPWLLHDFFVRPI